jgi:hydrogenase/urease accessory protein HupE
MKWLASILVCWCSLSCAHLLPKQNATINIVDSTAYLVVSVPASALKGVDDDGNGLFSAQEIQKHTRSIELQVAARLHVSASGVEGTPVLTMVMAPHTDGNLADSDYVVVMHRVNFGSLPTHPTIETDLFGTKPGETKITITATRGKSTEITVLEALSPSYTFFQSGWAIFSHFVRIGTTHILGGLDHLLFLLTIIIGAAGWRYWLCVVTSFTLAHSITLVLSALNIVRPSSAIVEPGIAISIVLMALTNLYYLYRPQVSLTADLNTSKIMQVTGSRVNLSIARIFLVFACGLLHGFGFASAIGPIAFDTGARIATLAGFNIGIELGQLFFLVSVYWLTSVLSKIGLPQSFLQLPKLASISAVFIGVILLVQQSMVTQ